MNFLRRLGNWFLNLFSTLYDIPTVYRLFWTGVQVGAGYVAAVWSDDPRWGVAVTLLTVVVTSVARESLAKRNQPGV